MSSSTKSQNTLEARATDSGRRARSDSDLSKTDSKPHSIALCAAGGQPGVVRDEPASPYQCTNGLAAFTDDEVWSDGVQRLLARMRRQSDSVVSPADMAQLITLKIGGCEREEVLGFWLDNRHCLIALETLARGTIDSASLHPREVVRAAIKHNAAALVLAHNHPSGDSTPSAADFAITARIRDALTLIDVRLLDHFVVGGVNPPVSMARLGWAWPIKSAAATKKRRVSRQKKSA